MPEFYLSDDKTTACMKLDETRELFVRKVNDGLVIDVFDSAAIEINGPTFSLFIKNSQLKQTIEDLKSIK